MRESQVIIWLAAASVGLLAGAAQATVIAVDFNNGGAANQSPASAAVAGPYATAGWNNLIDLTNAPTAYYNPYNTSDTGSPLTLVDTSGASTGIQCGFNSNGFSTYNGGSTYSPSYGVAGAANSTLTADQQLYNGTASAGAGAYVQQVTLSNIPYATYNVYVLTLAVANGLGNEAFGGVQVFNGGLTPTAPAGATYWFQSNGDSVIPAAGFSYVQATGTSQASATAGANYALFSGLSGSVQTFDIFAPGVSYSQGMYFSGLEIVSSVPEPASLGILGLVGAGVALRRRHWR